MRYAVGLLCLAAVSSVFAEEQTSERAWTVRPYTQLDLFAYSEPVSVDAFINNFDDDLEDGDTAFTQDVAKLGVEVDTGSIGRFRLGFVQRYDYITSFTEDTALYHHAESNGYSIDNSREYDLLLDVERVEASGLVVGYSIDATPRLGFDIDVAYYNSLSQLQSGLTGTAGDLEPLTAQLEADIQAVLDGINGSNTDLSPLLALVEDVAARIRIDYAYDDPKFNEEFYREPVITGDPNPIISGVDFSEPEGSGYSIDLGVSFRPTDDISLRLDLYDIANEFNWENAPRTTASFSLNEFLVDAIGVAQVIADGGVATPNDLIDRHLAVDIRNTEYSQELPWRADLRGEYRLGREWNLWKWSPSVSLLGRYYHTDTKDFPAFGVGLDSLKVEYDAGAEAFAFTWDGRYLYARLMTDTFDFKDANAIAFAVGFSMTF